MTASIPATPARIPVAPRWLWTLLALCLLAGGARAVLLSAHQPLIALANSYDEARYTACFDLYPDRARSIAPTQNSPQAPYERYAFIATDDPMCYWSSELLFQGVAVAFYHLQQRLQGNESFSVRWIGALKLALLLGLWAAFGSAWLRRGERWSALANGLLLPLLLTDPANTIYLNTFYAEWAALIGMYLLLGLILLYDGNSRTRRGFWLLATAAFALAASKIQHLFLPLSWALVVLLVGRRRERRWTWQGVALLSGACLGAYFQFIQLQRDSVAIRVIDQYNRADAIFTGLLPNARDPALTAQRLGLGPECLAFIDRPAWQLPDLPERACPGLIAATRRVQLGALAREPDMALRLMWRGVETLDPWVPDNLGLVAGGEFTKLPDQFPTWSRALTAAPWLRLVLLVGPLLALPLLAWNGRWRVRPRFLVFTALVAITMLATLAIALLGDGLADTAKQGHLITNAALAWWLCGLVLMVGDRLERRARLPTTKIAP